MQQITSGLYTRHIPYGTLQTAMCTRLHYLLQYATYLSLAHPLLQLHIACNKCLNKSLKRTFNTTPMNTHPVISLAFMKRERE